VTEATEATEQPTLRDKLAQALEDADYRQNMRRGDLADALMPVVQQALNAQRATHEIRRLTLSEALGLGTSAPWDAITERAATVHTQLTDYENRITWETTCGEHARLLDSCRANEERAEQAEAARDRDCRHLTEARRLRDEACGQLDAHQLAMAKALGLGNGATWDTLRERAETAVAAASERADLLETARDALSAAGQTGPHGDDWPAITPSIEALAAERDEARHALKLQVKAGEQDRAALDRANARAKQAEAARDSATESAAILLAGVTRVQALAGELDEYAENALKVADRELYAAIARGIRDRLGTDTLARVLADVAAERARQDARWGVEDTTDWERISILTEEVGEAAKAANEANFQSSPARGDRRALRAELVQVAAVAASHIEQIDRLEAAGRTEAP